MAEDAEQPPQRSPGDERRDHHAEAREEADRPLALRELGEVDVQRAGEEQEREHAVEERAVELDRADCLSGEPRRIDAELAERHEKERQHEREEQHRHAHRLADVAVVHPAEERGEGDEGAGGAQRVHGSTKI